MKKLIMMVTTTIGLMAGGNTVPESAKVATIGSTDLGFYMGIGVGVAEPRDAWRALTGETGYDFDSAVAYVDGKIGYEINDFAAIQVSGFYGELINNLAVDGVIRYENSTDFTPYFFVGYGVTNYTGHPYQGTSEVTGLQFGLGGTYDITKNWGITGEVRTLDETDDHVVSVGVVYSF